MCACVCAWRERETQRERKGERERESAECQTAKNTPSCRGKDTKRGSRKGMKEWSDGEEGYTGNEGV